ncbi:phosphoribosyltransferase [Kitasatospora sp. NPDC059817]|uniref:phosphoribosyltransferase n=1 Tax=Kitasatospora sp. NPDC059817 TaxID=3346961 RepID=UPI003647E1DD
MAADRAPRNLTWGDIETQTGRIASATGEVGIPHTIVAVVRGGMVPAVLLAHRLAVRDVRAVEVTHTVDDSTNAAKTARPVARNAASLGDLSGLDVLVVDDVAGTGDTLAASVRLAEQAGAARVRSAVLVLNEANWTGDRRPHEAVTCIGETVGCWVVFPWEENAPASAEREGSP